LSRAAKVWAALWAVYLIWGSTCLAIAVAIETLPTLLAVSTRFVAAGAIMAAVVARPGGSMRVPVRAAASCVVIGCLLPGANAVLFFAEHDVPTGLASLIIASVPLWVMVLRLGVARERLPWQVLAGVGVGFAGVAVLAQPSGGAKAYGIALCVLSAVMWATGSFLSSRLPLPADSFVATSFEMLAGGLILLPIGLATTHPHFSQFSGRSIFGFFYLVTFGSVIGYTAYVWLLDNAPLGKVATYAYVNPVVAIALGVIVLHESLTWTIALGAVLVLACVAVVVRRESELAPGLADDAKPVPIGEAT